MITAQQLYEAYKEKGYQNFMPISQEVAEEYLNQSSNLIKTCPDLKYVTNLFYDWVGANQKQEEGAEEEW